MAAIGKLTISGKSGTVYTFDMYPIDTNWKDNVACLYYISKRTQSGGHGSHTPIYIGQTQDLKTRHIDHHKQECFDSHGYNCISLLLEASERKRLAIELDLLEAHNFPCNG